MARSIAGAALRCESGGSCSTLTRRGAPGAAHQRADTAAARHSSGNSATDSRVVAGGGEGGAHIELCLILGRIVLARIGVFPLAASAGRGIELQREVLPVAHVSEVVRGLGLLAHRQRRHSAMQSVALAFDLL